MNYNDCQKIVDATKSLFANTSYSIEYYLDGEPFFLQNGEMVEWDDLPKILKISFGEIIDTLEIEY